MGARKVYFKRVHIFPNKSGSMCGHHLLNQPGKVANSARGQLNRENYIFLCSRSRLRIWSSETCSAVPSRASLLILHTQAKIWCLLTGFLSISTATCIYLYRHTPSGQPRVYLVTHLRTDGVHCRESASTGSVIPKIVRVTVLPFQVSPLTNFCAPLFQTTHYWYGRHVRYRELPSTDARGTQ